MAIYNSLKIGAKLQAAVAAVILLFGIAIVNMLIAQDRAGALSSFRNHHLNPTKYHAATAATLFFRIDDTGSYYLQETRPAVREQLMKQYRDTVDKLNTEVSAMEAGATTDAERDQAEALKSLVATFTIKPGGKLDPASRTRSGSISPYALGVR